MKNQLSFFAAQRDLVSLLRAVESRRPLQFVRAGLFDSAKLESLRSLSTAPQLGLVAESAASHDPRYLVADHELMIEVRPVPQRRGGIKYAVDQAANPKTIGFQPGGTFGEKCLIAGQVGTVSNDPDSLGIFRVFSEEIKSQFTKVKTFYVGKEAGELLDKGWRLTANVKSPALYDLKREADTR
jgi:hypothetical protein